MYTQCKKDFRVAIANLYAILALLISAMVLLFIAVMVNSNIWTFLVTWIWVLAAFVAVSAAFAIFDNIYHLKLIKIKQCLIPICSDPHYRRYSSLRSRYKTYNGWVIAALIAAFLASFLPFTVAFFIAIVMLSLGPLIAFTHWMIIDLNGLLKCLK